MILAPLPEGLDTQIVLQVKFVLHSRVSVLQLHESFKKVREKDISVEVQRALVAYRTLPALVLSVDADEARQVEALKVRAVLSAGSFPDRAHRDWATRVQQDLIYLLHVCFVLNEANVVVDCFFVAEELLGSLQGDLGVFDPILSRELEELFW